MAKKSWRAQIRRNEKSRRKAVRQGRKAHLEEVINQIKDELVRQSEAGYLVVVTYQMSKETWSWHAAGLPITGRMREVVRYARWRGLKCKVDKDGKNWRKVTFRPRG